MTAPYDCDCLQVFDIKDQPMEAGGKRDPMGNPETYATKTIVNDKKGTRGSSRSGSTTPAHHKHDLKAFGIPNCRNPDANPNHNPNHNRRTSDLLRIWTA